MLPIQKVVIIGGGSSGWMTATFLKEQLGDLDISVIEASDIPIIGVGESTNVVIRYAHNLLGINENAFMRATNAAFKIAIRFEHFNQCGGVFYHPFGQPKDWQEYLFRPNAQAVHDSFRLASTGNGFSKECCYAYQLDAGLYGQFLRTECKKKGVRHIVDRVLGAGLDDNGDIAGIHTEKSGTIIADLYIDCSGFRSFLLGGVLHEPFRTINNCLVNDKAIAARVPYIDRKAELKTFTNCTALSAGWVWQIPLSSRLGIGYVYSSSFLSQSAAEKEFRTFLGEKRAEHLNLQHIDMKVGRHDRAWVRNCAAIGISYGFIEPLESTGLSLTQVSIMDLAEALRIGATSVEREIFNRRQAELFDTTRDFVLAHYVLTERSDTEYWRHIRYASVVPESLAKIINFAKHKRFDPIDAMVNQFYRKLNWNLILSGMGVFKGSVVPDPCTQLPRTTPHARYLDEAVHVGEYIPSASITPDQPSGHPIWCPTW